MSKSTIVLALVIVLILIMEAFFFYIFYIGGVLIFSFIIIIMVIYYYNKLVKLKNSVKTTWSQIDIQLNRRIDLIPNLVNTVKGYAAHEEKVLTEVTQARSGLMNASSVENINDANNQLYNSLKSLFAVAESYPELKANTNFQDLQNQLKDTEDKISSARTLYNNTVFNYNNSCETFPGNLFADIFNFKIAEFFKAETNARSVPKVEF